MIQISNGVGLSRAAKKRAKKRKKELEQQQRRNQLKPNNFIEEEDLENSEAEGANQNSSNEKLNLFEGGLGEDDGDTLVPQEKNKKRKENNEEEEGKKKRKRKRKKDTASKKDDKEGSHKENEAAIEGEEHINEEEWEKNILGQVLGRLAPMEILYPETFRLKELSDVEGKVENVEETKENDIKAEDGETISPNPFILLQQLPTKSRAKYLFNSLLAPSGISVEEFYLEYWEKKPLLISKSINIAEDNDIDENGRWVGDANGNNQVQGGAQDFSIDLQRYRRRFDGLLSKKDIELLLQNQSMKYGKDLNVTNYCRSLSGEKERITLDQLPDSDGLNSDDSSFVIAESQDVWANFDDGCSVRLLCPHKHNDRVHFLLSMLEQEFGCMVGANAYLTPGGNENQGFAPHYDDIEAFILQLEGFKRWCVYPPRNKRETLPRESSRDFTEKEMKNIEPIIDVELGPGDFLYMPRGWIHQAKTCRRNQHSLHLTASAMQNWAWVDFLENIMPEALEAVSQSETTTSLREGLPRNFLDYMGTMHDQSDLSSENMPEGLKQLVEKMEDDDDEEDKKRKKILELQSNFKAEAKKKIMRVCKEALTIVNDGCDRLAQRFLSDRLPPAYTPQESIFTSDNRTENGGKIWPNTMVRLARPGIARLIVEDGKAVIYHCADNSRVHHEVPLSPMEFEIDDAPALEMLLTTCEPHWICVEDLIHGDIEDKMEIAQSLYDEGILAIFQKDIPNTSVQTG